ncbi:MAG: Na/Pi symporter [Candidatus Neomarinimicrobiota bacterium]
MSSVTRSNIVKAIAVLITLYLFLLSIKLLGHSFKLFGRGFAEAIISMTSNPFAGLIIGVIATSLIQSSSTTTSIVVGLVAGEALTLGTAIPIIMGANIGTTITNSLVSIGYIRNRIEFQRAFSASIVHDLFNICAVIILFPLEMSFHIIARIATVLEKGFSGAGGLTLFNPLKFILEPTIEWLDRIFGLLPYGNIFMLVFSLILLFGALTFLIKTLRTLMLSKIEAVINEYLFRSDLSGFVLGILITVAVQSSSITTSLIVPLAGAGFVSIRQIFPFTLGANIGTTVTALLAAIATLNHVAVTVAFSHLCFNILGIMIFYPLRFIPISLAEFVGEKASRSTRNLAIFISVYILLYFVPIALIFLR